MITTAKHTALLVFSLSSKAEARRKPIFGPGNKSASRKFYELLTRRTHRILRNVPADTFWIDESSQSGDTFGERIGNAMDSLYTQGYQQVVVIGNDAPGLTSGIVRQAITLMNSNDSVLGPAKDGGAYLIGLCNAVFDKTAFTSLPWESGLLFKALEAEIKNHKGQSISLDAMADLDTQHHLTDYCTLNPDTFLGRFLLTILVNTPKIISGVLLSLPSGCFVPVAGLRGPPR